MPKVSVEHGEHVRQRIVEGAIRAFSERGFHDATIQDVVRHSGLSVGAIYTWFSGKDELLVASCEQALDQELAALAGQLVGVVSVRDKLVIAARYWFDFLEREADAARFMIQAWAEAAQHDGIREMLLRRRERLAGVAAFLLREGVARGEIAADVDIDALARGFGALLDGLLLQRMEEGTAFRRNHAERRAMVFIDILYRASPTTLAR